MLKKTSGSGAVTKSNPDGSELSGQQPVGQLVSAAPMATVGVEASFTRNMGNFESVRLAVTLLMPSEPEKIEETFQFATEWVNEKMDELQAGLVGDEPQA